MGNQDNHAHFVKRLKTRIAEIQSTDVKNISIAKAAKDIGCAETTLRSTLEGRYPRSEEYWRRLRTYCTGSLDWLICGLGDPPCGLKSASQQDRILGTENDFHKLELIKMALKGKIVDVAQSPSEAAQLNTENIYDLILSGPGMKWSRNDILAIRHRQIRPKLIHIADDSINSRGLFGRLADQTINGPLEAKQISTTVSNQLAALNEDNELDLN